jgi:hypothetical protein
MVALRNLNARIEESPAGSSAKRLHFLCPGCCQRRLLVDYWAQSPSQVIVNAHVYEVYEASDGLDQIEEVTLVADVSYYHGPVPGHSCVGWTGHIRHGQARPGESRSG